VALVPNSIYAYTDLNDVQVFIKTDDLLDRGDWNSSLAYALSDAAFYLGAYYVCLTANTNTPPSGNISEEWSTLALVREGQSPTDFIVNGTRVIRDYHIAWGTNPNNNEVSASDIPYQGNYPTVQTAIDALFASTGTSGINTIAQQGSAFAYNLYLSGTNYTNAQMAVEVVTRSTADQAETAARIFGDGTTLAAAKAYADSIAGTNNGSVVAHNFFVQGTNYTNDQFVIAVQNGSQFSVILRDQGTNYTDSRVSVSAQQGSQYSTILRDQGTNYADSQIAVETAARISGDAVVAQHGSELAYDLYWAGTNFTLAQGGATTVAQQGSQYSTILRDQGTNFSTAQDVIVAQQGSNYAFGLYVAGTNYAASLSQAGAGSLIAQNGSQFAVILRDQGTNFTLTQVAIETSARIAADLLVERHGSELTNDLYWAGTNFTISQVATEAAARTAADLLVERHGSELAYDLYWQGTNSSTNVQLADAGVTNDGAGLSTARVGSNLPIKRIKAGTNIAIENNGTNVKIGIDTFNTTQSTFRGPSVGEAGVTTYAGTVFMDFGSQAYSTITLAGNLYIIPTGMQAGRGVSARLIGDTVDRSLDFAGGVRFIGSRPTTLAANKIAVVSFSSYSNDLSNVVGAYSAET
jgi:hypothetical protein